MTKNASVCRNRESYLHHLYAEARYHKKGYGRVKHDQR